MPDSLFHRTTDKQLLARLYRETPHEGLDMTPEDFAGNVGWRVYTEWCMSPTEGRKDETSVSHYRYGGIAFEQFVNQETHFLLSRQGRTGGDGKMPSPEEYGKIRERVMGALVKRAVDGFKKYGGHTFGWEAGDNMRCNLQPWIGQ